MSDVFVYLISLTLFKSWAQPQFKYSFLPLLSRCS